MLEIAGMPQAIRKVGGADENHVDIRYFDDLRKRVDGGGRFHLDDHHGPGIRRLDMCRKAEWLDLCVVRGARCRQTAIAQRLVFSGVHGGARFFRRVDHGNLHALQTGIETAPDRPRQIGRHARDRGHAGQFAGAHQVLELAFVYGRVLAVE